MRRRAKSQQKDGADLAAKHMPLCRSRGVENHVRHEMEGMRLVGHLPGCLPLHGAYARQSPWADMHGAQYYLAMPCALSFPRCQNALCITSHGVGKLCQAWLGVPSISGHSHG